MPGTQRVVLGGNSGLSLFDVKTGAPVGPLILSSSPEKCRNVILSPDDSLVAMVEDPGTIRVTVQAAFRRDGPERLWRH